MNQHPTLVAALAGILIVAIVLLTLPSIVFEPCGLVLPTPNIEAPSTGNVAIFTNAPINYQTLGLVRITQHFSMNTTEQDEEKIFDKAKALAASVGANGVLVKFFAHSTPGRGSPELAIYSFSGEAIRTTAASQILLPPLE